MNDFTTIIIGAGFTGLAMGIQMRKKGIADFAILERADDVGGVWRDNTYPGVGVDTPSKIYMLATDPNPKWSLLYAKGDEIQSYTQEVADRYDLRRNIQFGVTVTAAQWDPSSLRWRLQTDQGEYTAGVLITAAGLVADPSLPRVPGVESFEGEWFHSSKWNHDLPLEGRKVAVIGSGASSIQFVPEIVNDVDELHVVQRTPSWVFPKVDAEVTPEQKARLASKPSRMKAQRRLWYAMTELSSSARQSRAIRGWFQRKALEHLNDQVKDPDLRAKLLPPFEYQCKRPLLSSDYYPALQAPQTTLHTGGLVEVRPNSIVTGEGREVPVDTIIYNTGFEIGVTSPIARVIHDADGKSLHEHWGERPRAYKGVAVPGFPNLFVMQGPNATSGVSSSLIFAEAQALYISDALVRMSQRGIDVVEVSADAEEKWTAWVRKLSTRMVYERGGCVSYYLNAHGENVVMWPTWSATYQLRTRRFDLRKYHARSATPGPARQVTLTESVPA